jgi:Sulfotransferase family
MPNVAENRIAVLGLLRSGSTAVAGALHHLGVRMGRPFHRDYYESDWLSIQLRNWWPGGSLVESCPKAERIRVLTAWMLDQERSGAKWVGMKHPYLTMCGDDLLEAWGPDVRFIWSWRPVEESIASLTKLAWWSPADSESIQRHLWDEANRFFAGQEHLRVELSDMTADPAGTIDRIIRHAQIDPEPHRVQAAVKFIRPGKSG